MKPKSFTKKRNNYNQHCKNNKNAKKRKFSQSNHNINESPQPQKRKLNKCIQNIFEKNRQLRKEIYLIKQERDKYKKERDYYCNRIQKCLKIVRGTKNINQFQNNNQEQVRIYTETQSDEANDNDNNKIFANDNPIEIVLLLLEKYPQIDRWLNSMEYHSVVTTSHTHSIHLLTYLMNKQPQFTQVIEVIQQQLTCTASTTNLSAYISPAPIHWQITSCTDEKKEGKWRIKLKVIKNPLKEALLRIGTKRFNLDDMFDILADVEDNDDIKRTNTARRRLREELFLIRGCYEVSKAEFDASDFVNSFHDDAGSDGGSNHDDICYECGNCGELVCCDGCPHAFHLLCVGLSTVPNDKWFCNQCICMFHEADSHVFGCRHFFRSQYWTMSVVMQILVQSSFFFTGPPMVLLYQKETYIGGNYPWSFLANVSQYSGMVCFSMIPVIIDYVKRTQLNEMDKEYVPLLQLSWIKMKYILPIALFDVFDVCAAAYAYEAAGATIYIVLYSSVTIFTGLIRKFYLRKNLTNLQWFSIIFITVGLALTCIDSELNEFNIKLIFGIFATLIAALCDAAMYVFSERALDLKQNKQLNIIITEWEITTGVGIIGLFISLSYIAMYSVAGQFNNFVSDHFKVSYKLIIFYWSLQAFFLAAHYIGFYYVVGISSSVTAAVNKALQSVLCFAVVSIVFCHSHSDQCFTWIMGISAAVVNIGTVLYAFGKKSSVPKDLLINEGKNLNML